MTQHNCCPSLGPPTWFSLNDDALVRHWHEFEQCEDGGKGMTDSALDSRKRAVAIHRWSRKLSALKHVAKRRATLTRALRLSSRPSHGFPVLERHIQSRNAQISRFTELFVACIVKAVIVALRYKTPRSSKSFSLIYASHYAAGLSAHQDFQNSGALLGFVLEAKIRNNGN